MTFLWLILTAFAAISAGVVVGHTRVSHSVNHLQNVHLRQAPWMLIVAVTPLALLWVELWLRLHADWQWFMPFWVQRNFVFLINDFLVGSYGFLAGFVAAIIFRTRPLLIRRVVTIALVAESAILALGWHNVHLRPVVLDGPWITSEGAILQTSDASCAPAASANILQYFGITKSESELARLFGTQEDGTLPGQIALGFEQLGFVVTRKSLDNTDIKGLTPPALLFLDNDCHVIALLGLTNELATVVDPDCGLSVENRLCINKEWSGHALEIQRPPRLESGPNISMALEWKSPLLLNGLLGFSKKTGPPVPEHESIQNN